MKLKDFLRLWCSEKHWTVELKTNLTEFLGYTLVFDSSNCELCELQNYKDYIVLAVLDGENIIIDGTLL